VNSTLAVGKTIVSAAGMSFLGLGISPPNPEWGAMLSEGKEYIRYAPNLVLYPGMAIMLAVLSLNLLGDGLNDALDPRLKQ
ncbi:MAG TPA: ABC transporter permease subunit, partial [Anaerolineaceae bacterium]|nr:ABC transporter permease subunit [Anaerolineaceae bacterium]